MKVSIIVPIYNVEKYVDMCVESLLVQSYKNIEILLIDDGSTDRSKNICEKYKMNDSRIKLYSQKNSGVSSARNLGLRCSTGDYIMFVDSDDWVEKNYVEKMMKNISKCDCAICGYYEEYKNKTFNHRVSVEPLFEKSEEAIIKVLNNNYGGYIYNKIFKRKILLENNIIFDKNVHMCEDMLFVVQYLTKCNNVYASNDSLYHYRMRKSSAVWQKNNKYITVFTSYDLIENLVKSINIDYLIDCKRLNSYFMLNSKLKKKLISSEKDFKKLYKKVINTKEVSNNLKLKLFLLKNFKIIYNLYMKLKIYKNKRFE